MEVYFAKQARLAIALVLAVSAITGCGGGGGGNAQPSALTAAVVPVASPVAAAAPARATAAPSSAASSPPTMSGSRPNFLGAFFRPQGPVPYGVFSAVSPYVAPAPYPTPGTVLFGAAGYCDEVSANGQSISSGYLVDPTKLADIVNLGVKWTRTEASSFDDDLSHIFGPGEYAFGDFDSAQCALERNGITPVVGLDAGPVQYNATPGTISPTQESTYATAADFGQWCGVVTAHENAAFPGVTRFSLPGNEVDSDPGLFPGGNAQIAAYSEACYAAVKAANPRAFVYGFELNMDGSINVPAFISALAALGCKAGTCYDGIAMHLTLVYPIPAANATCYPNPGGTYGLACITAVEGAANVSHVLISETMYPVPGSVPDEATKALAVAAEFTAFAASPTVDGVSYANVDECALYPSGYFFDGCLISTGGQILPAYTALQQLAERYFQ
jgi:hypothetical protein